MPFGKYLLNFISKLHENQPKFNKNTTWIILTKIRIQFDTNMMIPTSVFSSINLTKRTIQPDNESNKIHFWTLKKCLADFEFHDCILRNRPWTTWNSDIPRYGAEMVSQSISNWLLNLIHGCILSGWYQILFQQINQFLNIFLFFMFMIFSPYSTL